MISLREYQKTGAAWLACRVPSLLADDPGLGKTAQALTALKTHLAPTCTRALVVCPASLMLNWQREISMWTNYTSGLAYEDFPLYTDIVIVPYSGLKKWHDELRKKTWEVVICDEAHYLKTIDSQRTLYLRGGNGISPVPCNVKIAMTGTPMLNRPIELYPILKWLDASWLPVDAKGKTTIDAFGRRYCGGMEANYLGATNLPELRENLKTLMLRRLKKDVLTELPEKTRQIIELKPSDDFLAQERAALAEEGLTYEQAVAKLDKGEGFDFSDKGAIAKVRRMTGEAKIEAAAKFILNAVEEVGKVVVFAWHRDVIQGLMLGFDQFHNERFATVLVGGMTLQDKQYAVDQFQNNPKCSVFFGNIQAAGTGITLTAASLVIFVEMEWTPGANVQAEDRCHRIGQRDNVFIQYLVLNGSLDAHMARALVRKQAVLDDILN